MTSDAVLRRVRALTLPSVLFTSGLAGHAAAGGVTPAASVLVPLFVLTVVAVAQFVGAPYQPGTVYGVAGRRAGIVARGVAAAQRDRRGHDNCGWRGHRYGDCVLVGQLAPDDAPRRCGIAWFCDVADE